VTSPQLALQKGTAAINFNTAASEPVGIAVYNAAGAQVQTATLNSNAGANSWTWDGTSASGATMHHPGADGRPHPAVQRRPVGGGIDLHRRYFAGLYPAGISNSDAGCFAKVMCVRNSK